MRSTTRFLLFAGIFLALVSVVTSARGQGYGDLQYQRFAIMNGNQVRTVFGNWGVIGQPATQGRRGAWRYDNDGYLGDVSPLIGAEVRYTWPNPAGHTRPDTIFFSVLTCPVDRPAKIHDVDPASGIPWTLEPEPGYFNPGVQSVAMSTDSTTWPPSPGWPDKLNDPKDPGWVGSWNGYFGKKASADLETYYVMDDQSDKRFNNGFTSGIMFIPDSLKGPSRDGLGLVVRVRALQWAQFLAKDNIFWLYEIANTGTTSYDRAVFGMLVGTYVGVTSTEDYQEYTDDWSFYDATQNITYTGDFKRVLGIPMKNPLWIGQVGMVGYAFLESPGNPFDGIDNDGDADSSAFGRLAPQFTEQFFAKRTLKTTGDTLVIINQDYSRSLLFVPPGADSIRVWTHGMEDSIWLYKGVSVLEEGDTLHDAAGNASINPNVYDGIDNNFNGLIDENYYLDYHQLKQTKDIPPVVLINNIRALRYTNYRSGAANNPFSMIDERRDDLIDNDNDWSRDPRSGIPLYDGDGNLLDDVGRDGIQYTNDLGERDGNPTSGYDVFGNDSGLPGEPHIDKTDVKESDQIGLTSFFYFTPAGDVQLGNKDYLWKNLAPGYFDVPLSIRYVGPSSFPSSVPLNGEDGDFFYGSGYFPLLAGKTERFSLALVYGGGKGGTWVDDISDLLRNKITVQKIYDANYQFSTPPDKPHITAVPGDKRVTLYWDRRSEAFVDPVLRTHTFEGYKIYRSTDPDFNDIFTITDALGSPQGYQPLAQFDLIDNIKGNFQATGDLFIASNGYTYNLGKDNGLQHSYVDSVGIDNGRRYFYAVVSYSMGNDALKVFPAENTKRVSLAPTGEVSTDVNVAVVVPNAPSAGLVHSPRGVQLATNRQYGTGTILLDPIDEAKLQTHQYRLEFADTQIDSLDADGNVIAYTSDSTRWTRITTDYSVRDLTVYTDQLVSRDTIQVYASHKNIIPGTLTITDPDGNVVQPSRYVVTPYIGGIRGAGPGTFPITSSPYTIRYQYFPVFRSPYLQNNTAVTEHKDSDIFDGVRLIFNNVWSVTFVDPDTTRWVGTYALPNGRPYQYKVSLSPAKLLKGKLIGIPKPSDYQIQFSSTPVDTSVGISVFPSQPVNFRVFNLTDSVYSKFFYFDADFSGNISQADDIVFLEKGPDGRYVPTWALEFSDSTQTPPGDGVTLILRTKKPFRNGDQYVFTPQLPSVSSQAATNDLDRIRVVPNPYVAASAFELPLPPAITSGRQRRIDFIHLPATCTVKIFTSRGDHVITLVHEGNLENGSISWNLKSKENLDVAFGIYFYVVESPMGTKTGKIAIIK